MSSIFNFNNNDDDDDDHAGKIDIDELYEKKQQDDLNKLTTYKKILAKVHSKIKITSRQDKNIQYCWYVVPELILGLPHYTNSDCIAYLMNELNENGFSVNYTHPNLIFISWANWVPAYVRNEIKKKTGIQINQYGTITNKPAESNNNLTPYSNSNNNRQNNNNNNINNSNNSNNNSSKSIYNADILSKFNFKFNK